jgi:HTH-type transcriptional regulator / antitoxin HigA
VSWVRPERPGDRLAAELAVRRWTQTDFAEIIGRPLQMVNEVINGKKEITRETAAQIGAALQTGASYWLEIQDEYLLWELLGKEPVRLKLNEIRQRALTRGVSDGQRKE